LQPKIVELRKLEQQDEDAPRGGEAAVTPGLPLKTAKEDLFG